MRGIISFEKILEPGQIGKVRTKNRIIKVCGGAEDITGINRAFLEAIARGGAGLIVWGDVAVEYPIGVTIPITKRHLVDDENIPAFAKIAEAIHRHDCPVFMQLFHAGPQAFLSGDLQTVSASSLTEKEVSELTASMIPRELTIPEIELRADKGIAIEEAQGVARILQDAGVDAVHVRAFGYHGFQSIDASPRGIYFSENTKPLPKELDWSQKGKGAMAPLAAAVKKVVSIPVITVGGLDPVVGEKILEQGKADFLGICKGLMADPEMARKLASGRLDDIAPCADDADCARVLLSMVRTPSMEKVTRMPEVKCEEITDKGVVVTTREGRRQNIEADTIITASSPRLNTDLLKAVEGSILEAYLIGLDDGEPSSIMNAIGNG